MPQRYYPRSHQGGNNNPHLVVTHRDGREVFQCYIPRSGWWSPRSTKGAPTDGPRHYHFVMAFFGCPSWWATLFWIATKNRSAKTFISIRWASYLVKNFWRHGRWRKYPREAYQGSLSDSTRCCKDFVRSKALIGRESCHCIIWKNPIHQCQGSDHSYSKTNLALSRPNLSPTAGQRI